MPAGKVFGVVTLFGLIGLVGFGFGVIHTINTRNPVLTPLPESQRETWRAEVPKVLDAFIKDPNDRTQRAAYDAIINYRRTFADMSGRTLQPKSLELVCAGQFEEGSQECRLLNDRATRENRKAMVEAITPISNQPGRSMTSIDTVKEIILAETFDRRIIGNSPLRTVDELRRWLDAEHKLVPTRDRLFSELDNASAGDTRVTLGDVSGWFKLYATSAENTQKKFRRGNACPNLKEVGQADMEACTKAVGLLIRIRSTPDRKDRVAILKPIIAARDATFEQVQQGIQDTLR